MTRVTVLNCASRMKMKCTYKLNVVKYYTNFALCINIPFINAPVCKHIN